MIRYCNTFAYKFLAASGNAMDDTRIVSSNNRSIVLSSVNTSFGFDTYDASNAISTGPIANVPRVRFMDSDDSVIFEITPYFDQINGLSLTNAVQNSMHFQIPGRGLFLENGLKVNAIAPAPSNGGMAMMLSLMYEG